ncbi:hypothetical protein [Streptomyces sp. NPDC059009]|uniref:hypothetical protein n=1 Tax=Streptomyces sp. NPDC059009 TaxID=3346694 RepID=UPI00367F2167
MSGDDWVRITRHWCFTEDRTRVVPETSPLARWLHWKPGDLVKRSEAERLGAVERDQEAEAKKAAPAANKSRTPAHNKRR